MSDQLNLNDDDATELEDSSKQVDISKNKTESVDSALSSTGIFQIDPDAEPLKVGSVINKRFELTLEIGAGGMGAVYQAIDRVSQEAEARNYYVAVKVLKPELSSNKQLFQLLHREFERTKRLVHKNIIDVHDFDRDRDLGCIYMTMEYLTGQTLSKLIKQSAPYTLQNVWSIIDGMGQALSFAHKNNIVHRDIKPGNVFITDEGIVKILDFGIASKINEQENDHTKISGHNLGGLTVTYASPEMLKDFEPDPSDDIYSFGCVIYELLTGKKFYNQKITEPEPIKGLTHRQMQALIKSLASTRNKRTKSIDELLEELKPSKTHFAFGTFVKNKYVLIGLGVTTGIVIATVLSLNTKNKESTPDVSTSTNVSSAISIQFMRNDSGISDNDFYTNDNQPSFFGKANKDETVKISLTNSNNKLLAEKTMIVSNKGEWSMSQENAEVLPDGQYNLLVSTENNKLIKKQIVTIDTLAPEVTIDKINQQPFVNQETFLTESKLSFSGKTESDAIVTVILHDVLTNVTALEKSVMASDGLWMLDTGDVQLPSGEYKVTALVKDHAGNQNTTIDKNIIIKNSLTSNTPKTIDKPTSSKISEEVSPPSITLRLSKPSYRIGEKLLFYFTVSKPLYVKAVHRDINNDVAVLSLNTAKLKPNVEYQFPPKNAKFNLKVQGPEGRDSITLVASEKHISDKIKVLNEDGTLMSELQNDNFFLTQINYDVLP